MNNAGVNLERIVRDSPTPQQAREMVDFIYDYCRMAEYKSTMSAEEIVRISNKVAPKVDAEVERLYVVAKEYPQWRPLYNSINKISRELRTDDPDKAFIAIDKLISVAHQHEPAILRQVFGVVQEPRAQDISTIIRKALDFEAGEYQAAKAARISSGGTPRPTTDPFNTQPGRGTRQFAPSNEGNFGPQGTRPEQPRPIPPGYTRPPMGRPPWEEGPVAPAARPPAPEPPVGATTLPQQNAPLEAPQGPLPPPGGRTVPPAPETANLEPGMAQSTHAKRMNETYNNMLYPDGNIPEYEKQNNAQLLARITEQDAADPERSLRIIRGQEPASFPERRAFAIVTEERMINSGDMENLT